MSVFDRLTEPAPSSGGSRLSGGSVFDRMAASAPPPEEDNIFVRLAKGAYQGAKETVQALPAVPEQFARTLAAGFQPPGAGLGKKVEDIFAAEAGDREAARRVKADQIVASLALAAPFGTGATLASQAGLGALSGAVGGGGEAAAGGQPVLPAAVMGGVLGGVLGPVLGSGARKAAQEIKPAAAVIAEPIYQAPMPVRHGVSEPMLDAQIGVADAVDRAKLQGMTTYAQEVRGPGGLAPEPNPRGSVSPLPPVGSTIENDPAALALGGGMPGSDPIPRIPTVVEQQDFFAPKQTTFLGPPGGKPKPGPSPQFEPSAKKLEVERFPVFRPSEQPSAQGSLTQGERAVMAADPEMIAQNRGLFAELGQHPGLKDRDARIAFANSAVGREIKSFNDLTVLDRKRVMMKLRAQRKLAENIPEAKRLLAADDMMELAPPSRFGKAAEIYHRMLTAVSSRFRSWGEAGGVMAEKLERSNTAADRRIANDVLNTGQALKGLSERERFMVHDVMQGAPNADPKIKAAAARLTQILSEYADEAERSALPVINPTTGKVSPFQRQANYYPQIHTKESIARLPAVEREYARRQMQHVLPKYRGGGIQFARTADIPGWEKDPLKALPIYFKRSAKRLADAREFGTTDGEAKALVKQIAQTHGREAGDRAWALYTTHASPAKREFSGVLQPIRDAASVSMLTTTALLQPGQLANTIGREGFRNTLKGLRQFMTSPAKREWAERTGATVGSILNDISPDGSSIASGWAKWIGLTGADRALRLTSALAARLRAEQVGEALRAGRVTPRVLFDAKRLGIPASGEMTEELLRDAAQRGSNSTQFASRFADLPEWRDNELGRTVYLFRSFALQQGRMVKDMVNEARRGSWTPLLRFAGASAAIGIPLGELIRKMKGNEAPEDPVWRALDDMAYITSLGMFQDAIRAASSSGDAARKLLIGPVLSEGTDLLSEGWKAGTQGETDPLMSHVARRTIGRVPLIGKDLLDQYAP